VKTAIFCICGSNNWETVVETGKLRWATYRFDPYDRHNLFKTCKHLTKWPRLTFIIIVTVIVILQHPSSIIHPPSSILHHPHPSSIIIIIIFIYGWQTATSTNSDFSFTNGFDQWQKSVVVIYRYEQSRETRSLLRHLVLHVHAHHNLLGDSKETEKMRFTVLAAINPTRLNVGVHHWDTSRRWVAELQQNLLGLIGQRRSRWIPTRTNTRHPATRTVDGNTHKQKSDSWNHSSIIANCIAKPVSISNKFVLNMLAQKSSLSTHLQ